MLPLRESLRSGLRHTAPQHVGLTACAAVTNEGGKPLQGAAPPQLQCLPDLTACISGAFAVSRSGQADHCAGSALPGRECVCTFFFRHMCFARPHAAERAKLAAAPAAAATRAARSTQNHASSVRSSSSFCGRRLLRTDRRRSGAASRHCSAHGSRRASCLLLCVRSDPWFCGLFSSAARQICETISFCSAANSCARDDAPARRRRQVL